PAAERPAARPEGRPDAPRPDARPDAPRPNARPDAPRPDARPDAPRPDAGPGQRPTAPPVPPSATQPRPDLGRPDATPQQRPNTPPTPNTPPDQRPVPPNAPGGVTGAPGGQSLAPPLPRGDDNRPGDRAQDRDRDRDRGQDRDRFQPNDRQRVEERDGRTYIRENDNRLIIRDGGRDIVRHDEVERLRRGARDVDVQQRPNGRREIVIVRPDGDRIVTIVDADGNLLRRERRARDGRNYVLIENDEDRPRGGFYRPVELPPLRLNIPRERYIVESEDSSYDVIEETLRAAPVERVERPYSLDEVRYNQRLREKMSRIDIDTINFAFGAADVDQNGAARLDKIARALLEATRRNPNEVFLIEGHTDAVGADTDNLTLSDRRAESVASILTERYQIPPENLVTQGYGEQFLKVPTQAAEQQNRRVTVRRITPLLQQQGQNQAPAPR
ncbi:MAG: flagellar motor protein MotB, partial [Hyphomicrobiales bacterium]|nr:flagellar motor protein MotB [Hyphomicrobiales bacterium]